MALAAALASGAGVARAQSPLAPSLSVDTAFAPSSGIARDNAPTTTTDVAGGVAVDGERIYTVGESGGDVAIVARQANGVLDSAFSGDGRLNVPIGSGRDIGLAVVVLPDHRLRVLASTVTSGTNTDVAILGLRPDGSNDPEFGGGDGREVFPVGTGRDTPTRMTADAAGRLAIVGGRDDASGREDTFVALRAMDGAAINAFDTDGVRILDRAGPTLNDRAVDVAFRPGGGLVALLQVDTNATTTANDQLAVMRAFSEAGADDTAFSDDGDLVLTVGDPDTIPAGLLAYGGRLWVTGSTKVGADTDAFLARVEADGSGLESRRFDMRGRLDPSQAIVSRGIDLEVLPGAPDTLVVVGSIDFQSGTFWAAAAFNAIEGSLAAAGYGDLLIPSEVSSESGGLVGVAAGSGWLAAAGTLRTSSGVIDSSFGTVRLLVDAEKRCDLAVDVPEPAEIEFEGDRPAGITARVTNEGTKACAGVISVAGPYQLRLGAVGGAIGTGVLFPGASYATSGAVLSYSGARRRDDVLQLRVTAAGDANPDNDTSLVRVVFSYCDLQLGRAGSAAMAPTEGSRRFEFSLRNAGTVPCRRVRLAAGPGARARRSTDPFTLEAGRSASEEITAAVAGRRRVGRRARMLFRALGDADVDTANNTTALSPMLIGVGDTTARTPRSGSRRLSGRAAGGRGPVKRRHLRVRRVEIAVRRLGRGCRWLASSASRFRTGGGRRCDRPVWLRARGTRRWRFALRRALPRGRYVLYSRATIGAGFPEASFSARDRNRITFRAG